MTVYVNEVTALKEFVDGLKKAAGYAHALAHYQANPLWLSIRDKLELLIEHGQALACSKALPRSVVLDHLGNRAEHAPKDQNGN